MPRYTMSVLGLEVNILTDADGQRVTQAKELVEAKYEGLNPGGKNVSKEKLLTVLALSLADDYMQSIQRLRELEEKLQQLVEKIDWTSA